jgi:hypothetical protein
VRVLSAESKKRFLAKGRTGGWVEIQVSAKVVSAHVFSLWSSGDKQSDALALENYCLYLWAICE